MTRFKMSIPKLTTFLYMSKNQLENITNISKLSNSKNDNLLRNKPNIKYIRTILKTRDIY